MGGGDYVGNYIHNFNSYRKLQPIVHENQINGTVGEPLNLKVYNPYNFDIDLQHLKFGMAYMDSYKKVKEIVSFTGTPKKENTKVLRARDTTYFEMIRPEPKIKEPGYLRVVLSENNLYFGLNGKPIPIYN